MQSSLNFRVGQGFDVHRFAEGRRLVVGGVVIPHSMGLEGHSDADVLTHAVCDALLGAAAMGDIGQHFPDTDAKFKDADSIGLLRHVAGSLEARGWGIVNVDTVLIAEAPKFAPHVEAMRVRLAEAMGIEVDRVGIKATTSEKMGFTGRREGIAAMATALIGKV